MPLSRHLNGCACAVARAVKLVCVPVFVGAVLMAPTVASAASWSLQLSSSPGGQESSLFGGVSCSSSTACTTVGSEIVTGTKRVMAERWNGTEWSAQTISNPPGATSGAELRGVSCASSTSCIAVGTANSATSTFIFSDKWNGTSWSAQTISGPSGTSRISMNGVSCTSSTACTAVGSYTKAGTTFTLAERWNGSSWSSQTTPNPTGSLNNYLFEVSCSSSTACTAVGRYEKEKEELTLAESWNGTEWSIQETPNPVGSAHNTLHGVSCTSSTACTAVGNDNTSGALNTLAERWNGTGWSIQTTPAQSKSVFEGVSCVSSTTCMATGRYTNEGVQVTLAESWNGTEWSVQTTPNPEGAETSSFAGAVACTSSTFCLSVGEYYKKAVDQLLAEKYS